MMKKLWLVILVCVALSACGGAKSDSNSSSGSTESSKEVVMEKPKAGETVAFVDGPTRLGEGSVEGMDGARYKIKYGDSTVTKDESDVYVLPKPNAKPQLKVGDMVAGKFGSDKQWQGAEVLKVGEGVIELKGLWYGTVSSVSPDKIIVVRPAVVAGFQKAKAENEFLAKAKSLSPVVPDGWKPKAGDKVVAEWMSGLWYAGNIVSVTGERANIKWYVMGWPPKDIGLSRIAPYPMSASAMPGVDSYVIVKNQNGSDTDSWKYATVTAVNGQTAEVKHADGKTRTIRADDFIALK